MTHDFLRELKAIKRKVEQTLFETRQERGASVDELRAVFIPITRKLKRIRNKLSEAAVNKAGSSE